MEVTVTGGQIEAPFSSPIFFQGGGFCVPYLPAIPGFDCEHRCKESPHLCTAHTDPFLVSSFIDQAFQGWQDTV